MTKTEFKAIRRKQRLSQAKFGLMLDLSRYTISNIERGERIDKRTALAVLAINAGIRDPTA